MAIQLSIEKAQETLLEIWRSRDCDLSIWKGETLETAEQLTSDNGQSYHCYWINNSDEQLLLLSQYNITSESYKLCLTTNSPPTNKDRYWLNKETPLVYKARFKRYAHWEIIFSVE